MLQRDKILSLWLFLTAFLVFCLVIVGGATRLTGSGLSITEWKPVMGVLPPLSHETWLAEFEKYQQISQFKMLNQDMTLAGFKAIYFWEWGHRLLARFIGVFLLLPFLFFTFKGWLNRQKATRIFLIGCLIGLQGLVGWIMVASGLKEGMTAVAPLKLMFHLTLAAIIFGLLIKEAFDLKLTPFHFAIMRGLILQIALGALVAGNHAGLAYNTFPLMDGGFAPSFEALFAKPIWFENFIDNVALVQLNHRLIAYALLVHIAIGVYLKKLSPHLLYAVLGQAAIGILTLLLIVPISLALLHQAYAFSLILLIYIDSRKIKP